MDAGRGHQPFAKPSFPTDSSDILFQRLMGFSDIMMQSSGAILQNIAFTERQSLATNYTCDIC